MLSNASSLCCALDCWVSVGQLPYAANCMGTIAFMLDFRYIDDIDHYSYCVFELQAIASFSGFG